jgi:hypothetical protein
MAGKNIVSALQTQEICIPTQLVWFLGALAWFLFCQLTSVIQQEIELPLESLLFILSIAIAAEDALVNFAYPQPLLSAVVRSLLILKYSMS